MATSRRTLWAVRRRWLALGLVLGILVAGGVTTAAVVPGPAAERDLGTYFFGPQMARAEVVMVVDGVVKDFRIDQGRIRGVRFNALDVVERDGTIETIAVAPDARIQLNGLRVPSMRPLRKGMLVVVIREADGPAMIVKARWPVRR